MEVKARGQRGFVLVAVLWMMAGLAALVSAYSAFAVNSAASVYLPQQALRVDAALRAALELTAYRQLSWPRESRPSSGAFSIRLGDAKLDVAYRSETGRIDINHAPRELLAGLFTAVGEKAEVAAFVADRIVAWRSRLDDPARRVETDIYRKAKLSYGPASAPFDNVLELALLPDVSPGLLTRASPYLTIFSGSDKIDPLIADPPVVSALPGLTPKIASALRTSADALRGNPRAFANIAAPFGSLVSLDPNDSVRADIVVAFPDRRVTAEIVLHVSDAADEPYEVLSWRDDRDGSH